MLDGGEREATPAMPCATRLPFEGVFMVLSGMSNYEQFADNVSYMKDFQPLYQRREYKAVERVREILKQQDSIPCLRPAVTVCRAARSIFPSPACSAVTTPKTVWRLEQRRLLRNLTQNGEKHRSASAAASERACPQHLPVIRHLKETAALFETQA